MQDQITTLGILFLFAVIGGLIAGRFKQPVVLALMILGALIGPNLFGIVKDASMIDLMIEFGTILFLFGVGMEFSLKKLMKTGSKAIVVSIFKVGIMFFLGFTAVMLLGFDAVTAAFVGVAISFSSTMIIMNVLKQKAMINRKEVPIIIGVLVLEDIFGVIALTFFASMRESGAMGLLSGIQTLVISLSVLVIAYVLMSKFAEGIVNWLTKHAGEEIIPFISLGLCAGFAYLAFALELSPGAGAFLAGSVVSTFRDVKVFEHSIKPHSFMFTSFFFIAMGTMIDFSAILENLTLIIVLSGVIIAGLFIAMGLVTKVFAGFNSSNAVFSTIAMLPPGVFSLLVAKESIKFNVATDLVSIISVIIFVLSIVMTLGLKYMSMFNDRIDTKKPGRIGAKIDKLSRYISNFFDEIDLETTYTRRLKMKATRTMFFGIGAIISLVAALRVTNVINPSPVIKYVIYGLGLILGGYLAYRASKESKDLNSLIIRVLSSLEGGTRIGRTRLIVKNLRWGIFLVIMGLFLPLAMYAFKASLIFLIGPALVVCVGVYFFANAMTLMSGVSMDHKYAVHTYKKVNISTKGFKY